MSTKNDLRRAMRRVRGGLSPIDLQQAGDAVAARVLALPEVASATAVFCYVSYRREVPTRPILEGLLARGVEVAVPHIEGDRMTARALGSWSELTPGAMGIPTTDGPRVDAVDVAVCPGLAFDARGGRLGYGGSYYDRWLRAHGGALTVALAVDEAVLDEVPLEDHDVPMARIVTPTRVIYCGSQPGAKGGEISR